MFAVENILRCEGHPLQPVIFTSNAAVQTDGQWLSVRFAASAKTFDPATSLGSLIRNTVFEFGGISVRNVPRGMVRSTVEMRWPPWRSLHIPLLWLMPVDGSLVPCSSTTSRIPRSMYQVNPWRWRRLRYMAICR